MHVANAFGVIGQTPPKRRGAVKFILMVALTFSVLALCSTFTVR
jgi:hypothetical protein